MDGMEGPTGERLEVSCYCVGTEGMMFKIDGTAREEILVHSPYIASTGEKTV